MREVRSSRCRGDRRGGEEAGGEGVGRRRAEGRLAPPSLSILCPPAPLQQRMGPPSRASRPSSSAQPSAVAHHRPTQRSPFCQPSASLLLRAIAGHCRLPSSAPLPRSSHWAKWPFTPTSSPPLRASDLLPAPVQCSPRLLGIGDSCGSVWLWALSARSHCGRALGRLVQVGLSCLGNAAAAEGLSSDVNHSALLGHSPLARAHHTGALVHHCQRLRSSSAHPGMQGWRLLWAQIDCSSCSPCWCPTERRGDEVAAVCFRVCPSRMDCADVLEFTSFDCFSLLTQSQPPLLADRTSALGSSWRHRRMLPAQYPLAHVLARVRSSPPPQISMCQFRCKTQSCRLSIDCEPCR